MSRVRRAVETTINGDAPSLDPATRRGLLTLADHIDDLISELEQLRKTVMVVGTGIVLALVTAAISQLLN